MRNRYKSVAALRDDAKGFMNGNYGRAIGITFMYGGFYYLANVILSSIDDILIKLFVASGLVTDSAVWGKNIVYLFINILLSILLAVFSMGMKLFYLKLGCRADAFAGDLFSGFKENFSRNLQIAFMVEGPVLLVMAPLSLCISYYYDTGNAGILVTAGIAALVGGIIAVFLSASFRMSYFMMFDFSEHSSVEILKSCWKKMKGNRWRLIGMELSFLPYVILGILSLGIGLLWVYPLMQEAEAQFYLDLMNPKKVSEEWERTV